MSSLFGCDACFNRFRDRVGTNDLQSGHVSRSAPRGRCRNYGFVEAKTTRFAEPALDLANRTKLAGKTDLTDRN